ncbi:uncharacterized protein LOC111383751 isoform X1 [Olea europaea var. sylvestris]|uniref:uncharacterized protein LOC111383751 isoform X1 n=1 Tax=Olea europaea var. sylvestris TaxID=158386 RepID=UPI000C1D312D|nr:uncharacterized protein LOC111383751 isoform X1 [Olea europaea var. sylvestris]
MAEDTEDLDINNPQRYPSFVEVICKSSGKTRRFAADTDAGFAVNLINKKLHSDVSGGDGGNIPLASYIEAVKEGEEEEPISFGPRSVLADYGPGWRLQTVVQQNGSVMYDVTGVHVRRARAQKADAKGVDESHSMKGASQSALNFLYVGKILFAFLLLFVFGAIFTLLLENLPQFILYINSSV